jgi:WhiB family redox-sensing transcriptional regulator
MPSSKSTARILLGVLRDFSRNTEWMSKANCKDMNTEMFFPQLGGNFSDFVKEVCLVCPVIEECAWYANESESTDGMFGGMSPNQRQEWRKRNSVKLGWSRADWEKYVDAI